VWGLPNFSKRVDDEMNRFACPQEDRRDADREGDALAQVGAYPTAEATRICVSRVSVRLGGPTVTTVIATL
jgi:hypothetical protein